MDKLQPTRLLHRISSRVIYRRRPLNVGFSLFEIMVATGLGGLVTVGVVSLFITMLRFSGSVSATTNASIDAGNTIQRVTGDLREARDFSLMDGGTYATTYDATDVNGNVVAVTGVHIIFPASDPTGSVFTAATGGSDPLTGTNCLYDRTEDGPTLDIYRSNPDGTPNPSSGSCLWASGKEHGVLINKVIIKSVSPGLDSIQFIQPYLSDGITPIANEIQIKIACAYADPLHGYSTNESSLGKVTRLTGECVYLRDHNPYGNISGGAHGRIQTSL